MLDVLTDGGYCDLGLRPAMMPVGFLAVLL